jgi:hypothetical protein
MPTASDTSRSQITRDQKRLRGRSAGRAPRHVSVQDT